MFRRFSINFALLSMGFDAVLVALSLLVAANTRPLLNALPFTITITEPMQMPAVLYLLFPVAWVGIFLLFSVYDGRRNLYLTDEFTSLTLGSVLAGVSLAGTLYLSYRDVSRALFLAFVILTYLALITWRIIVRIAFRVFNEKPEHMRRVLIVGAGPVGRKLQEQIVRNSYFGLTITGFLDDDPLKCRSDKDVLGPISRICRVVSEQKVSDVVIALPHRAHKKINQLIGELHSMPVKVWVIPDYFQFALHKAVIEEFAGIPMLDLRAPALNDYQRMVKRAFDYIAGTLLLIPLLPIIALISIAIKLDSPGPAIFKQRRVGENGRLFWMYKFRSMVEDAEQRLKEVIQYDEAGNMIHKLPDDPRVTRVGRFLRKTSLDELPQLFNVLKGDMSLVGPRPELPLFVDKYEPWQRQRFAVPQGVTGWWQINGRSDKPMHLNTEDDLYYVKNYSILLDILIIIKTIWVVFRGKGAF